jgi:hypothetical protein
MTVALLLAALPALYWPQPATTAPALTRAGIERVVVPPADLAAWQASGLNVRPLPPEELAAREVLEVPGTLRQRLDVASATLRPWIDANGWRIRREPSKRYAYQLPAGRAALAAAEAFAYGADAMLTIDPADLEPFGGMLAFLSSLPPAAELPSVTDVEVVDDGSAVVGEVLNLLARRNLLAEPARQPVPGRRLVVRIGSKEFPEEAASDPDAFALMVRHRLGDERRSLRLYGSEVVIARLTGDAGRRRLHLLDYGGRGVEGLRVRLPGAWTVAEARVAGRGRVPIEDYARRGGATEFSLPWLDTYAVVDLRPSKD